MAIVLPSGFFHQLSALPFLHFSFLTFHFSSFFPLSASWREQIRVLITADTWEAPGSSSSNNDVKHLIIIIPLHATYQMRCAHEFFFFAPRPSFTEGEAGSGVSISCPSFKAGVRAPWAGSAYFGWRLVTPVHSMVTDCAMK